MATVELTRPVEHAGRVYTQLTVRPVSPRDYAVAARRFLRAGRNSALIGSFAAQAGVPEAVIKKLSPQDGFKLLQALHGPAEG